MRIQFCGAARTVTGSAHLLMRANIETMDSFSAHADKNELMQFISNQKGRCKRLYLVHGEIEPQRAFAQLLEENGFSNVHIPKLGKAYELQDHI